jgi:eukaryotic-like serine/threonine-protein kinase
MGFGWMMLGSYDRAEEATREGIRRAAEIDLTRALAGARHNLGMILALRGDVATALVEETTALEAMLAMHDDRLSAMSRAYLALIQEMAGDLPSAEASARQTVRELEKLPALQARAYATLARILMRAGKTNEAAALEPSLAQSRRVTMLEGGDIFPGVVHVELLLAINRTKDALAELRELEERVTSRAARIAEEAVRTAYLRNVPENARVLELSSSLGAAPHPT